MKEPDFRLLAGQFLEDCDLPLATKSAHLVVLKLEALLRKVYGLTPMPSSEEPKR